VILLEEGDFGSFALSPSSLYVELWDAANKAAATTGGDWYWARRLPSVLSDAGLADVRSGVDLELVSGGSLWSELCVLTFEQLTLRAPLRLTAACYRKPRSHGPVMARVMPGR
jgi:hypothetical protein